MRVFRERYLQSREGQPLVILDYGSLDVNGSLRAIFDAPNWRYIGVDLEPGANVDMVVDQPYRWRLASRSIDVVVSGQALEHTELFWRTIDEIDRVLKPDGLCCLIAPSSGPEHRYPVDCWRFYPDGLRALALYGGFEPLEIETRWADGEYADSSNLWHDSVLVARRRRRARLHEYLRDVRRILRTRL
jgi:SAM-dependent methyltransferase